MLSRLLPVLVMAGVSLSLPTVGLADEPPLQASLVSVDVTPPVGVPLAGYGGGRRRAMDVFGKYPYATYFKPSKGIMDAIFAKILVLRKGDEQLAFIAFDFVGVSARMRQDLASKMSLLGFRPEQVFLSATHTHSGPGTLSHNRVLALLAMDHFQPKIYDHIMNATWEGVVDAMMTLEHAELSAYSFQAKNLQHNRRGNTGHFDPTANVLLVRRTDGEILGALANFAVHGTAMGTDNLMMTADIPGAMRGELEKRLAAQNSAQGPGVTPVVFINGAEGDVSPIEGGPEGMALLGPAFAEQAIAAIGTARSVRPVWKVASASVEIGHANLGLKACMDGKFPVTRAIGNALMPVIWKAFPTRTEISVIQLDDIDFLTWPGEPTTTPGLAIKALAQAKGAREAWVFGLTNDYLAYFTMPDEYESGGEGCGSLFGPQGAVKMIDGFKRLLVQTTN